MDPISGDGPCLYKRFRMLLKDNSLPHTRFHDLRHAYASMLINEVDNIDLKTLSEILGHSNISVTAEVYTHLLYKKKKIAIDSLNRIIADYSGS